MRVASSLENIKLSLKIDHNYDDPILNVLIDTAEDYIVSAIDSSDTSVIKEYKQFDWSVSLLAQHWYLNQQEASGERIPTGVQAMIQQMRGNIMPIIKNKVQLNERITFVEMKSNGGPEPGEVEEREVFSCWCYIKGNTIRDIKEQHGTIYEGTVNFVIRYQQQEEINNKMQIRFHNKLYNIVTINEDSSDKAFTVVVAMKG